MTSTELIYNLPKGIVAWYEFNRNATVLAVGRNNDIFNSIAEYVTERVKICERVALDKLPSFDVYDYVIIADGFECIEDTVGFLKCCKSILADDGKLLLFTDNRFAIRYFVGDRDPYTGRSFDGIENYARIGSSGIPMKLEGRAWSKAEITKFLENAGFNNHKFYSVFPDIYDPQVIYSQDCVPEEKLAERIFPKYHNGHTVFLEEEKLLNSLADNDMIHQMANGYFIECSLSDSNASATSITISMDRGPRNAMCTVIYGTDKVEKRSVYAASKSKIQSLYDNNEYLKSRGIHMIDGAISDEGDKYIMPYTKGVTVTTYFQKLILEDKNEQFYSEFDRLIDIIYKSSDVVDIDDIDWDNFEPFKADRKLDDPNKDKWKNMAYGLQEERSSLGPIFKRCYIDLVPVNCFYIDGEYIFYDQELYIDTAPAKVIVKRTIDFLYISDNRVADKVPRREMYDRYGITECEELFDAFINEFFETFRNDKILRTYRTKTQRDYASLHTNRQKINFSVDEYNRFFKDIFDNLEGKKIYLFGAGAFAKRFLSRFGKKYNISGIIDNNSNKWGQELDGISIVSPEILKQFDNEKSKIIITIKNYLPIIKQFGLYGITNFGVFDPNVEYKSASEFINVQTKNTDEPPKKYHIGYVAGVFDMFHVGHLNILKKAKEECDYLIVGVVSDEQVMNNKRTMPMISFEDRREIIASCKYVDEAVRIPPEFPGSDEAFLKYHFDAQFSGSDYEDDPVWLATREWLRAHGSDLVFFPYTESVSSTMLKSEIRKG